MVYNSVDDGFPMFIISTPTPLTVDLPPSHKDWPQHFFPTPCSIAQWYRSVLLLCCLWLYTVLLLCIFNSNIYERDLPSDQLHSAWYSQVLSMLLQITWSCSILELHRILCVSGHPTSWSTQSSLGIWAVSMFWYDLSVATNTDVHVSFWRNVFVSWGKMPRRSITSFIKEVTFIEDQQLYRLCITKNSSCCLTSILWGSVLYFELSEPEF